MSLTSEEEERLILLLSALEDNIKLLSEWERGFVLDNVKRYDEYKSGIRLSPKQWQCLDRIYKDKISNG